jgi:hypothetical protein
MVLGPAQSLQLSEFQQTQADALEQKLDAAIIAQRARSDRRNPIEVPVNEEEAGDAKVVAFVVQKFLDAGWAQVNFDPNNRFVGCCGNFTLQYSVDALDLTATLPPIPTVA